MIEYMCGEKLHTCSLFTGLLIILILYVVFPSCTMNDGWEDHYESGPEQIENNVLDLIGEDPDFSMFYDALIRYGYDKLLTKNQFFTLFVPVNNAFSGLPDYSEEEWERIIGFHILYSRLFSHDFKEMDLLTIIGKFLEMSIAEDGGFQIFESPINMGNVDNFCQNGVIHELSRVLIPRPNLYEYIMALDSSYSILQGFLNSLDRRYIDYEKSERIGVDDNGNAIYDTVWKEENYFLDQVAGLDNEAEPFTGFLPANRDVSEALDEVSVYFGDIGDLDEETYSQLLFITFSGSFTEGAYLQEELPDTMTSVTGKTIQRSNLVFRETDLELSNGIAHLLDDMVIPKDYFLLPITIECERRANRSVSNTVYPIEERNDTRASDGAYVWYGSQFVGDYIEFTVNMVLKTTYWVVWTGPKLGPSHYQISIRDESTGVFVPVGDPVNNWDKGNFIPVVSGTHTFGEFGTKLVRITIVDERPLVGYNSIYVDYIKLIPDEIYVP
jgi:uncharacterized surface protein with fasciclin (FAS1) repeats